MSTITMPSNQCQSFEHVPGHTLWFIRYMARMGTSAERLPGMTTSLHPVRQCAIVWALGQITVLMQVTPSWIISRYLDSLPFVWRSCRPSQRRPTMTVPGWLQPHPLNGRSSLMSGLREPWNTPVTEHAQIIEEHLHQRLAHCFPSDTQTPQGLVL